MAIVQDGKEYKELNSAATEPTNGNCNYHDSWDDGYKYRGDTCGDAEPECKDNKAENNEAKNNEAKNNEAEDDEAEGDDAKKKKEAKKQKEAETQSENTTSEEPKWHKHAERFLFIYPCLLISLKFAHLGYLLYVHYCLINSLEEELSISPAIPALVDGIPLYLAVLACVLALLFRVLVTHCDRYEKLRERSAFFVIMAVSAGMVLYPIQIIVLLCKDLPLALEAKAVVHAAHHSAVNASSLGAVNASSLGAVNASSLEANFTLDYSNSTTLSDHDLHDSLWHWHAMHLFLWAEISITVIVLRVPFWVMHRKLFHIYKKDHPSQDEKDSPSQDKNGSPSQDKNNSPSQDKNNSPSQDKNNSPSQDKNNIPSQDKNNSPSQDKNNSPSQDKNNSPSQDKNNSPSQDKNNSPSQEKNGSPSQDKKDCSSCLWRGCFSKDTKRCPCQDSKKSCPCQDKKEDYLERLEITSLAFYGLAEGLDGFSFMADIMNDSAMFSAHMELTIAILFFMSLSTFLVHVLTYLGLYRPEEISIWSKPFIVVCNNIPFVVIRIYIVVKYDQFRDSLIFVLFLTKEIFILLMAVFEFVLEIIVPKDDKPKSCKDLMKDMYAQGVFLLEKAEVFICGKKKPNSSKNV